MKTLFHFAPLLLLASCGEQQPESVLSGFDPANPQASLDAIAAGFSSSFLEFSKETEDLGDVFQHQEIILEFPFVVNGDDAVVVTGIDSSCGCTDAMIEVEGKPYVLNDEIPAGSSGYVRGVFKSAQYSNEKASKITIRGNGTQMPRILQVEAFIHQLFEMSPKEARFGDVSKNTFNSTSPMIEIALVAAEDFEILNWLKMPDGINIVDTGRREIHADGERHLRWFRVSIGAELGDGHIYQSAIAETTMGRNLEFVIQANIFGPVRYDPDQRLTFGLMDRGQSRTRRINVRTSQVGLELGIPSIEIIGPELFTTELVEKQAGEFYVLKVSVGADAPVGHHNAVLRCTWPEDSGIETKDWNVKAIIRERK